MLDAAHLGFESPVAEAVPEPSPAHRPLLRLWLPRVRAGREDDYRDFVGRVARPVLQAHDGCGAVTRLKVDDENPALLTQWRSADDLVALQLSPRHQAMVEPLLRADIVEAVAPASLWPVPGDVPSWVRILRRHAARAMGQLMPLRAAGAEVAVRPHSVRAPEAGADPSAPEPRSHHGVSNVPRNTRALAWTRAKA